MSNPKASAMTLQITSMLAGAFALLMVPLSLQVSLHRLRTRSNAGKAAPDEGLRRKVRAHGNFIEYAPMALILVGLVEFAGASRMLVAGLALAFLVSRIAHAIGMLHTSTPILRAPSMFVQHVGFVIAGGWLIAAAL